MPTPSLSRDAIVPFLLAGLLALSSASVVTAAKGDQRDRGDGRSKDRQEQGQERQGTAPQTASAVLEAVPGARLKMARTKVANSLTRIADDVGDQRRLDGSPATAAEPWSDIASVHVARIKVPGKLEARMFEDFPRGARGSFYGADADWSKGDRAVFVAVELAGEPPADPVIQQVEIGLDGDGAGPLQPGAATDPRAGLERFSLSGTFSDGSSSSGTTDVSGRLPGEAIEYYNANSRVFGFYDAKRQAYFLIMPVDADASSVSVALRTVTPEGELIDRLELPDGGHFISLDDAFRGWDAESGTPPLACRSLETLAVAGLEPGTTRIRYAAGADPSLSSEESAALLAALDGAGESVAVELRPARGDEAATDGSGADGADDAERGGEEAGGRALIVDAALSRAPGLGAFTLTLDAPPGTWHLEAVDGEALTTPAGEALVDGSSLVGSGGLRTAAGLEGFVAGDAGCARFAVGDEDVCTLVPPDGMAALVGLAAAEVEQRAVTRPDGSAWCVGTALATGEVQYIARFGTSYLTSEGFAAELAATACPSVPVDRGAEATILDCGAEGYERHLVRVVPESIASRDPDGGLLLSVDLLVDRDQPVGQRYDPAAAEALFGGLVDAVALAAAPAVSGSSPERSPAADVTE